MYIVLLFVVFGVMLLFSIPIAFCMGASAVFVLLIEGRIPLLIVVQKLFSGMDSLPLLAIPFFMLAGSLMEGGGISSRLVRFASALVGHFRGGISMVSVLASMIFAGISGSSAADTTAIGSILMPAMIRKGYPRGFAATLQACAGTIGPIIPPSILMIIYGSITGLSIGEMFLAGVVPGVFVGVGLMVAAYIYSVKEKIPREGKASWQEIWSSFKEAVWALVMPLVIIGGIVSGIFTATEAGMIAVFYGLVVGLFIYREIKLRELPRMFLGAGKVAASLMFVAGMANVFAWVLARHQFPSMSVKLLSELSTNPTVILLLVILFFLILGCFVETLAAMIIFVPVMQPIVAQFGFDPIHFALVVIVTLLIGQVTPPVGVLLFLTTAMVGIDLKATMRYVVGFVSVMIAVLLVVSFTEDIVMYLPRLVFGK
jgi:C4-dicarboxylate transporter DctM subunit